MISLTIFKNIYDNKTDKRLDFDDWSGFESLLYKLSKRKLADKGEAELISPSTYQPETTRANKNVIEWAGWAAVDVDENIIEGDLEEELKSKFGENYYVCYSTASSRKEHPKFRLVFPLATPVQNENIKKFWFALQSHLGDIGDKQTKDLSRMYYTPAEYEGAYNFIFTNKGSLIDPAELIKKYPMVLQTKSKNFLDNLPESLQLQVIEHRKSKMENKHKYKWKGLHDCPFVSKKMLIEYKSISETGWYHKMYQFMCSVAFNAVRKGYPISATEVEQLARELDLETGNWYEKRPLNMEAGGAISYAYKNSEI